jgi:CDP-diacylglycerol pyrophosphatase
MSYRRWRLVAATAGFLIVTGFAGAAFAQQTVSCPPVPPHHDIIGNIADVCSTGCRESDLAHHYAIIKDNSQVKRAAYLLVARDCNATGIEAAGVLSVAPLLDTWAYAWDEAEKWLEPSAETGLATTPAWIGLDVNADNLDASGNELSRSMDRLHIHIACVRPDVIDELRAMHADTATLHFVETNGVEFTIVRRTSLRGAASPFALLPADQSAWRNRTIAVFGRRDTAAYYVAIGTGPVDHEIAGEELLDQMCATPAYGG